MPFKSLNVIFVPMKARNEISFGHTMRIKIKYVSRLNNTLEIWLFHKRMKLFLI